MSHPSSNPWDYRSAQRRSQHITTGLLNLHRFVRVEGNAHLQLTLSSHSSYLRVLSIHFKVLMRLVDKLRVLAEG